MNRPSGGAELAVIAAGILAHGGSLRPGDLALLRDALDGRDLDGRDLESVTPRVAEEHLKRERERRAECRQRQKREDERKIWNALTPAAVKEQLACQGRRLDNGRFRMRTSGTTNDGGLATLKFWTDVRLCAPECRGHRIQGRLFLMTYRAIVTGELDYVSAPGIKERLLETVAKCGPEDDGQPQMVLDLVGVPFIDAAGLGLVITVFKRLRERGSTLTVRYVAGGTVDRLLRISGLEKILQVEKVTLPAPAVTPVAVAGPVPWAGDRVRDR